MLYASLDHRAGLQHAHYRPCASHSVVACGQRRALHSTAAEAPTARTWANGRMDDCRGRLAEARAALVASLHARPCHWGAWQALAALAAGQDAALAADLPRHWARDFHLAQLSLEAQENDEALGRLQARAPTLRSGPATSSIRWPGHLLVLMLCVCYPAARALLWALSCLAHRRYLLRCNVVVQGVVAFRMWRTSRL